MEKVKDYLLKKMREYKKYRQMDRIYKLLSKFVFDGYGERLPSYYCRGNQAERKKRAQKELAILRELLEEYKKRIYGENNDKNCEAKTLEK